MHIAVKWRLTSPRLGWIAPLCKTLGAVLLIVLQAPSTSALAGQPSRANWSQFDRAIAHAQSTTMGNPEEGLDEARTALTLIERDKRAPRYREAVATALWLEAEALTRMNRIQEAWQAVLEASHLAAIDGKVTKLDGDLALSRARIAESSGDFGTALKNYQLAHATYARLGNARSQALTLLGLGDLYEKARDFSRETAYQREAELIYPGDSAISLAVANNMGFAYQQMRNYRLAIPRFERALSLAAPLHSPVLQAGILDNLAMSYARSGRLSEAARAVTRSLMLLKSQDHADEIRFAWGAKAEVDFQRGDIKAAEADLEQAFSGLVLTKTEPGFRDMHEIAYRVYRKANNLPLAIAHLEAFKRLDDRGRSVAASANLALLGAQFDFARQDLEIAHLRSAELERDIRLRKAQAENQLIVFSSVLVAGLLLLGWVAWRNALLKRHRNEIAWNNMELVRTLTERNSEIERRAEVEFQLRVAMEEAQQANRAKSVFLANMSHELRTPLNAIIGFSDLMLDHRTKLEKCREYAGNVADGGRHLLGVLNNVLDMARIEAGRVELADHMVRLGDVVDYTFAVLGTGNPNAEKELRSSGETDLVVRGDEVRLRQILINLVSNALKFTPEHGLIDVRVEQSADGVDVVVEDNGPGIPAEQIPVIMEPFGQAESSYTRSHGGVGLGLSIVKSLVELHGGTFDIESEVGHGTKARVHLPESRIVRSSRDHRVSMESLDQFGMTSAA